MYNRMKAFFIVPQITHYRITFYEKLIRENPEYDWLIIDGEKTIDDGRPTLYKNFSFPTKRFLETTRFLGPFTFREYEGLYEYVVNEQPDLVIMPTIAGTSTYRKIAAWCKSNNKKVFLWSCLWEQEGVKNSGLRFLKEIPFRRFINAASTHIAYSSYAKNKLIRYGISPEKIRIAYNGLEIEGLEHLRVNTETVQQYKEKLGATRNKILLYVGGLGKDKMVDLLIKAFHQFNKKVPSNNVKIIIIGDGPERKNLIELCKQFGLTEKVSFLGRIVDEVDAYFQVCDCYVMPGCGGLGLNQAMYWKKPCIVSHADGTEEDLIIDGQTGFRFQRSDEKSLTEAISRFYYAEGHILKRMGEEAAKIIFEKSNVNKMVQVFKSAIHEV